MENITKQLLLFKQMIEYAIITNGTKGKNDLIRSSEPINLIHDAVKHKFLIEGIHPDNIHPKLNFKNPELKIAGFLKQKDQDICITPSNILPQPTGITWGPLAFEQKTDPYGFEYTTNTVIINVRSQLSSLAKNSDTLFERTFAEAMNLHMKYPDVVLGEVYLIPVHEYDDSLANNKKIGFKAKSTNLEKYISFFNSINNRQLGGPDYSYERVALLIVDFNRSKPHIFKNSAELKSAGYISENFPIEYASLNFHNFAKDLLSIYNTRYNINNLIK